MTKLSEALKAILGNPDDLSTLPQLVARAEQIEAQEEQYQERINKLQIINREYLAQIPIPGTETKVEDQKDEEPTLDDAKNYLIEVLSKGDK